MRHVKDKDPDERECHQAVDEVMASVEKALDQRLNEVMEQCVGGNGK